MSDVEVPYEGKAKDKAILLLAAAEDLGLEPGVVRTNGAGAFHAPEEVVNKAFGDKSTGEATKKATSKKTAAKKAAAKKTADSSNQE